MVAPTLYHYTCDHGHAGVTDTLRPHLGVVWLTDLDAPMRDALGLTSHALNCDRSRLRYLIGPRREHTLALESSPGALPMHWWVSEVPVPVDYDPIKAATP